MIEDVAGVGDLEGLARTESQLDILGEALGKKHPNTISVQLQRLTDSALNEILAVTDDIRPKIGHHRRHLHGVPPSALPHDVPVETVEDDFVGQLHRFVEDHQTLCLAST